MEMKYKHLKAVFEMWQKEFIDDPGTPNDLWINLHNEDYPEESAKHFLELSEKIRQSHSNEDKGDAMHFSYVDIVGEEYKGWLNLFFGEYCIAMIDDPWLADQIRSRIPEKNSKTNEEK